MESNKSKGSSTYREVIFKLNVNARMILTILRFTCENSDI